MELGLRGRIVLVTGASKGIGFAVAEELAKEGCAVILVARNAADLERAAEQVARHGTSVSFERPTSATARSSTDWPGGTDMLTS